MRELDIELALPTFVGLLLRRHVLIGVTARAHYGAHPQRRESRPRRGQDRGNNPDDREEKAEKEEAAATSVLTARDRARNDCADRPNDDPRNDEDAGDVRRGINSSDLTLQSLMGRSPKSAQPRQGAFGQYSHKSFYGVTSIVHSSIYRARILNAARYSRAFCSSQSGPCSCCGCRRSNHQRSAAAPGCGSSRSHQ